LTWIDVVDSAVKIGLGAILAGAFTYLNGNRTLDSERRTRLSTLRRDHIEKILELVAEIENKYSLHKWRLEAYRFWLEKGDGTKAAEEQLEFQAMDKQLYLTLDRFPKASSILLLLGEQDADSLLWSFRDAVDEWVQWSVLDPTVFPKEDIQSKVRVISEARRKLLAALSRAWTQS